MNKKIQFIYQNSEFSEKVVLTLALLMPLSLCTSILISEIFASIIGLITIYWFFNKKNFFSDLKYFQKPLFIITLFYSIILVSLVFSNDFNKSFLPSFFYFRYILLAIGISYIFNKFDYSLNLLLYAFLLLILITLIDVSYEYLQIKGYFGLSLEKYRIEKGQAFFITGFFEKEKKLGSFFVRLLPFIFSLLIFLNIKVLEKNKFEIYIISIIGTLIFFSSERTSFFLFILFVIFSIKIFKFKFYTIALSGILISIILLTQPFIVKKYISATLFQFNINQSPTNSKIILDNLDFSDVKYLSEEHEKLIKSGVEIFKRNPLTGSGIKTYHETCNKIKSEESLDIECSTHPHNTYIQILSDTGIFAAIIIAFIFIFICFLNIKILLKKNLPNILKSFYILNLGIIINIMPFIPSGSIFNNWINLMIFFPISFWFYLFIKIKKEKINI